MLQRIWCSNVPLLIGGYVVTGGTVVTGGKVVTGEVTITGVTVGRLLTGGTAKIQQRVMTNQP